MPYHPIDRLKWSVLWLICLLAALSLLDTARAADEIYSFVDERGVTHLSNLPTDPRYQAIKVEVSGVSAMSEPQGMPEPTELALEEDLATPPGPRTFTPISITAHPPEER